MFPARFETIASRTPYEWVPQVEYAPEVSIEPIDNATFRVPGGL